jgi:Calcineurin-like phosphoesterase
LGRDTGFVIQLTIHEPHVALAGDWHGNIPWALRMVAAAHDAGVRVIVQLGDFGFWRDDPSTRKYLRRLERLLGELDMTLYWVDGNHEDHVRLLKQPLAVDGTRPISDHVVHLPRGFRWTWRDGDGIDRSWLALGGAVSVDRVCRTPGRSWWPEEAITSTDVSAAIAGGAVDIMVTHDAPRGVTIPGQTDRGWPAASLLDASRHRDRLAQVVEAVRPLELWHGHYHVRYDGVLVHDPTVDRPDGPDVTNVHGLDRDDTSPATNLQLVDAAGRPLAWPDRV